MNPDTDKALIVSTTRAMPVFQVNTPFREMKAAALATSALIGKVSDRDSKIIAVRAQQELKKTMNALEKARKDHKEPLLIAGRDLDDMANREKKDLELEYGRVTGLVTEFDLAEQQRVREEERLQREQIERIEREKQAELKRIADELAAKEAEARRQQAEADRRALDAKIAAEQLAKAATTAAQAKAALKARQEAEKLQQDAAADKATQDAAIAQEVSQAAAQTSRIVEKTEDAIYVASRPVESTHIAGQRKKSTWEIVSMNEWQVAKARPDLVRKIEFDLIAIKGDLARGVTIPGITAKEVFISGASAAPQRNKFIDV